MEGTFEGLQEGGRHFTAIFPKARAVPRTRRARASAGQPQPVRRRGMSDTCPPQGRGDVCRCLLLDVPRTQAAVRTRAP